MRLVEDLWVMGGAKEVVVGEVFDSRGKPMDLRRLIQRRWGWPKKAANRSVEYIIALHGEEEGFRFPVWGAPRRRLQKELLSKIPGLLEDLMEGMANRAQRDVKTSGRPVSEVHIELVKDFGEGLVLSASEDNGFLTHVMHAMGTWMGMTADEVRSRMTISRDESDMSSYTITLRKP